MDNDLQDRVDRGITALEVVQAMATYTGAEDRACGCCDGDCDPRTHCNFCYASGWGETHKEDCIVLKARAITRPQKT